MNRLQVLLVVCAVLALQPGAPSAANECPRRSIAESKPTLAGHVVDPARQLGLKWHSAAGKDDVTGWWTIDNGVCNVGQQPLIINWAKAGIVNDAYAPLAPGAEYYNEVGVGADEPGEGGAVMLYGGYTQSEAETKVYRDNGLPKKAASVLRSTLGAIVAQDITDAASGTKTRRSWPIRVWVDSTRTAEGYRFEVQAKAGDGSEPLAVALSSTQNEVFFEALKKAGVPGDLAPLEKIAKLQQKSNFDDVRDRRFVTWPISSGGKPVVLQIPASQNPQIEVATLIVIGAAGSPALLGKVSLFK